MAYDDDHVVPTMRRRPIPSLYGFRKRDKTGQEDAARKILKALQRTDVPESIKKKRKKLLEHYRQAAGWSEAFINQLAEEVRSMNR